MSKKASVIFALSLLAILLMTVVVYWPGLDGPFLLDDIQNISASYVEVFSIDEIIYAVTHNESGNLGRPVSMLSLVFSGLLHGSEPWGYKFHNLLIHLINGLLIFYILQKILVRFTSDSENNFSLFVAGMSASIWLLHPLMVSTVLYAVQRMAQLSTLFILTSIIIFIMIRENNNLSRIKFYCSAYFIFPFSLLLAMLSKENGALIPFYILMIELIVYGFNFSNPVEKNRMLVFHSIFVITPIVVGSLYTLTHLDTLTNYALRTFDMGERLLTQLHVVTLYLKMILLPRLSDMTLFHDYIQVTSSFDSLTIFLFLFLLFSVFLIFYLRKSMPVVSFAIAWFLVSHLMESTVFSLELMFEHRNYLAAAGPIFAVVYYLFKASNNLYVRYVTILILLLMTFLTSSRVKEWSSMELIYQLAIVEHPDSPRAQTEMAALKYNAGDRSGAIEHLIIAQNINEKESGSVVHEILYRCGTDANMDALFLEASKRAKTFPASAYSLSAVDNLLVALNEEKCPEVTYVNFIDLLKTMKSLEDNQRNVQYYGFLEYIEGQANLLIGNYVESTSLIFSAYEKTGSVNMLINLADNFLILNFLGDAEGIIDEIELINSESFGIESSALESLREKLQTAKERVN